MRYYVTLTDTNGRVYLSRKRNAEEGILESDLQNDLYRMMEASTALYFETLKGEQYVFRTANVVSLQLRITT